MSNNSDKGKKPAAPSGRPKIQTLADLNRRSDDSDSDDPQEFYTGGEKSGMLVQDPSKKNNDVDSIFEQARQAAAMRDPIEQEVPSSSSRSFTGTGRLLSGETITPAPQQPENVVHNIYFWSDGFSVDDGPLRSFDDPANAQFLESIRKSECPAEFYTADKRSAVHVSLTRRNENYPQPVKQQRAFHGVGRTLGSGSTDENPVSASSNTNPTNQASSPSSAVIVDDALPSTSIQLRLADGSRMVARFNLHHTVGHIRAFIDTSRPGTVTTYRLQTSDFPPKQLNDLTKTIEQAGLANSVIIQKL